MHTRPIRQNRFTNARPVSSLLGRQHQRRGNRRAQNVRGMQCMQVMHAMQMRPVQVLSMQHVKVQTMQMRLVMQRVQMMLVVDVRRR